MSKLLGRDEVLKDIYENHNHSWFEEIYERNKNRKDKIAISYWNHEITYGEFFDRVNTYAKAMLASGIVKGDDIVMCVKQMPDYPAIVAAISYIGAVANLIAPEFDKGFITSIINNSCKKIMFINDWSLAEIDETICASGIKEVVVIPMSTWGENPYAEISERFYKFDNDAYLRSADKLENLVNVDSFLARANSYSGELKGNSTLEDVMAITYSSGSTKKGFHKGIPQRNKTYIIMGRYHDPEVCGIPSMEQTRTYAMVGTQADTLLLTGVSDTMIQGGIVVLDPVVDNGYFLYALAKNRGGLVLATKTTWVGAMKEYYASEELKGLELPYMYVPSEGGEPLSAGEEYALNKWLRKIKAGTKITHTPFCVTCMSIGGGDSEHGSIFLKLFRNYYNFLNHMRGIHEPMGMDYYNFCEVKALREDGTYCEPMELGRLVANSEIGMEGYYNDPEATEKYFIKDALGKTWGDLGTWGYIDKWEEVYVKGRYQDSDLKIKTFEIADEILRDFKNIMSCEVVTTNDDKGHLCYVAHVEMQHLNNVNENKVLFKAFERCKKRFGKDLEDRLYFRIRSFEEGFGVLFTAKRNVHQLREEGISEKCIKAECL